MYLSDTPGRGGGREGGRGRGRGSFLILQVAQPGRAYCIRSSVFAVVIVVTVACPRVDCDQHVTLSASLRQVALQLVSSD